MCVCPSREGKRICAPVSPSEDFASIFLDGGGQGVRVSVLFDVLFLCPCWGNGKSLPSCGSVPLDNLSSPLRALQSLSLSLCGRERRSVHLSEDLHVCSL